MEACREVPRDFARGRVVKRQFICRPWAEELEPRLPPGDVLFGGLLARFWLDQGRPGPEAKPATVANFRSSGVFMFQEQGNAFLGAAGTPRPEMSLATLTARLSSGQHQAPLLGNNPAAVSLIKTDQGDTGPARQGVDGLLGAGLAGPGVVDLGAGTLDLSLTKSPRDW